MLGLFFSVFETVSEMMVTREFMTKLVGERGGVACDAPLSVPAYDMTDLPRSTSNT
jgi:hypothetical protein